MLIDSATLKEPIKPKAGSTLNNPNCGAKMDGGDD